VLCGSQPNITLKPLLLAIRKQPQYRAYENPNNVLVANIMPLTERQTQKDGRTGRRGHHVSFSSPTSKKKPKTCVKIDGPTVRYERLAGSSQEIRHKLSW
jgi:hypothetical protein